QPATVGERLHGSIGEASPLNMQILEIPKSTQRPISGELELALDLETVDLAERCDLAKIELSGAVHDHSTHGTQKVGEWHRLRPPVLEFEQAFPAAQI